MRHNSKCVNTRISAGTTLWAGAVVKYSQLIDGIGGCAQKMVEETAALVGGCVD